MYLCCHVLSMLVYLKYRGCFLPWRKINDYLDDLFYGSRVRIFVRLRVFTQNETLHLITAISFARWRVENIFQEKWQVMSGDGKVIRLGNFQYMLVIKEYGFSAAIGIKVILDFADSNEFSSYLSVSVLALILFLFF